MLRVKLLEITKDCDELIYKAARQCYYEGSIIDFDPAEIDNVDKLINHCISSGHGTIVEHAKATFAIDGISRALSHQLVRHRIASYSQQSQRYAGLGDGGFVIPESIRSNDQALAIYNTALDRIEDTFKHFVDVFKIPAEDARYILPNATVTRVVVTMNFRALLHFFEERTCKCAQWEIRAMALEMLKLLKNESIVFNVAGPKCERLGYCNESANRSCGRKPLKKKFLSALDDLKICHKELSNQIDDGK